MGHSLSDSDDTCCVAPIVSHRLCRTGCAISELLPWTAKVVDKMSVIRSVHAEAINHDPAITFMQVRT